MLREIFIQTIIDVMKGMDYLEKRKDINPEKIYYVGNSMGSLYGVMAVALERRFKRAVFIVGGADFQKMKINYIMGVPQEEFGIIDPKNYAGMISPRPVLLINALKDGLIPEESARVLFDSAKEPKKQIWLDSEHDISIREGVNIIVNWFKEIEKNEKSIK